MDSDNCRLKTSTKFFHRIELVIFNVSAGVLRSYKRFYFIRSELSVYSFYAKIKFDLKNLILDDFDTISFVYKGNPMTWSSNIWQCGPSNSLLRVYCLIFSNDNQINVPARNDDVREDPLLCSNIFDYIRDNFTQFRDFLDIHPEIQSSLSSNDTSDILDQLIHNPSRLKDIMMRHDQELRNIESLPGGYSALERLYLDIQEPLQNVFEGIIPNEYGDNEAKLNCDNQNFQIAENRRPLGNPWDSSYSSNQNTNRFPIQRLDYHNSEFINFCSQMLTNSNLQEHPPVNLHHGSLHNPSSQLQARQQPMTNSNVLQNINRLEERYSIQIELLLNMGFTDRNKILEALFLSNGDIDMALSILLTH